MFGTMFCQYETPCGWCVRLNKECTEKRKCKPEKRMAIAEENMNERKRIKYGMMERSKYGETDTKST